MFMLNSDRFRADIIADLGLDRPFIKGQTISVRNCWHFYTAGDAVDALFYDANDFRDAMNRIYVIACKYEILILAFVLMDTHIHFILYGEYDVCNAFMHEFIRLTSSHLSHKRGERKKLQGIEISHQRIDDDRYLRTAICYTIKNPPVAGLHYNAWDYPWSSGPLYFRNRDTWASPKWFDNIGVTMMSAIGKKRYCKTNSALKENIRRIDGIIFPGEYVAVELVEKLFGSPRGFNYSLCSTRSSDIESRGGQISHLSIPIQELRQMRDDLCKELFGASGLRGLDTTCRLKLAKTLKSRFYSSPKQIARVCGLAFDEIKNLW